MLFGPASRTCMTFDSSEVKIKPYMFICDVSKTFKHICLLFLTNRYDIKCSEREKIKFTLVIQKQLMMMKSLSEPHREKTGFLPMRKQRRRSASR